MRNGAAVRSLVRRAPLHHQPDGGSGVLRLLLLSVVNSATLYPRLTLTSSSNVLLTLHLGVLLAFIRSSV